MCVKKPQNQLFSRLLATCVEWSLRQLGWTTLIVSTLTSQCNCHESNVQVWVLFAIEFPNCAKKTNVQDEFWAQSIKILVFPSPIAYMMWFFGVSLLIRVYFIDSSKIINSWSIELQPIICHTQGLFTQKPLGHGSWESLNSHWLRMPRPPNFRFTWG